MNILIDTNVLSLAVLANTISLQAGALSNRIVLWQAKPRPEPTKETELYAIASLCAAAEAGVLTFWSSIGVKAESYRGRSWPKQNEYSLLRNINLRHAESAISYRNLGVDLVTCPPEVPSV